MGYRSVTDGLQECYRWVTAVYLAQQYILEHCDSLNFNMLGYRVPQIGSVQLENLPFLNKTS